MKPVSLNTILTLVKYKVSLAVTFTAITGYMVYIGCFKLQIITLACGVFILAGGSSALNEVQESTFDSRMKRTMHRPIPSGKISSHYASLISVLFIISGIFLLFISFGLIPALLGIFNIVWYNLLYTNLKRLTPFAVVPGSLVGAVPVLIGWTAAGGYLIDSTVLFIAFFLFIWQIPHFWLLMLKYGEEYEQAGFPTFNQSIGPESLKKIIFSWLIATSAFSITIPLFLRNISVSFFFLIFALNILFIFIFAKLSFVRVTELNFKRSFASINVYMVLFMALLILYHLSVF
ncbi:MAG: protoheme IX farnesyltransferase [Bacteroidota bacterium]|nr:protoheme IX farnesyltransferase [Bacteroidota bacterium]